MWSGGGLKITVIGTGGTDVLKSDYIISFEFIGLYIYLYKMK